MNLYKYYISAYVCCGPPECSRGSMDNLSNVFCDGKNVDKNVDTGVDTMIRG